MDSATPPAAAPGPRAAWITAAAVLLASLVLGAAFLGSVETGAQAEATTFAEAERMARGDQRFGIVEYTHYPNGPLYLTAAMTAVGLERGTMRWLPLLLSSFALGGFAFVLARVSLRRWMLAWVVGGCCILLLQPAYVQWQGAIHEHSYAVTVALLAVVLATLLPAGRSWPFVALGFVAGWVGYDWLPGQALVLFGARWLVAARDEALPLTQALLHGVLDTLKFTAGASLAILAHTFQLVLYFGDAETALRDLLGSAAARAGADGAERLNPEYGAKIRANTQTLAEAYGAGGDLSRTYVIGQLAGQFANPRWTSPGLLLVAAAAGLAALGTGLAPRLRAGSFRALGVGAFALAIALASTVAWAFLMPQHGLAHLHMLPRHVLLLVLLGIALPPLLFAREGPAFEAAGAAAWSRALALHGLWPVLTVALYGYALLAL